MEFTPKLLNGNKEKLEDIFKLRVEAWDKSQHRSFINWELYPNGLRDDLDANGMQWYIEDNNKVVGCIRMNLVEDPADFQESEAFKNFKLPPGPFIFFSRIAVHPDYQHKNLSVVLAEKVMEEFR